MAFNNTTVLHAILETCEPDVAIREASMGVSGMPLEYAFQVNENLNYLKQFVFDDLESFHALIHEEVGYDKTFEAFWALASFNRELSAVYHKYECVRDYKMDLATSEYLKSWFNNGVNSYYSEVVRAVKYFASDDVTYLDVENSLKKKVSRVASLYRTYLFSAVAFLASGAFMSEDASENEVSAWFEVFTLFSDVINFYNELDIIINEGL